MINYTITSRRCLWLHFWSQNVVFTSNTLSHTLLKQYFISYSSQTILYLISLGHDIKTHFYAKSLLIFAVYFFEDYMDYWKSLYLDTTVKFHFMLYKSENIDFKYHNENCLYEYPRKCDISYFLTYVQSRLNTPLIPIVHKIL